MTADDIIAYEKKLRWFQLLKDFNFTVTSTWTNNEESHEFHTGHYFLGPRNLPSETWYLNQVWIRTWDHFPVITRVEGQELITKKCVKGWAGWTPVSEGEVAKFQELVLRPRGARDEVALCEAEDGEALGPST